ncbi:MAG: SPOR domain-containing protein [Candidatus Krumholzibacteria bacterium]|nr:SPOR domain-containing protein [Candidatus Krumholzibacteria bacterium]
MHTAQMYRNSTTSRAAIVLLLILTMSLLAGCGGKDEAEAPAEETSQAMVPATTDQPDSTAGAGLATYPETATGPEGTSSAGGVQNADGSAGATLQASKSAAASRTAAEVKKSTQAPQVVESAGTFSLQLGSFRSAENARAEAERIAALGHSVVVEVASLGGQTYHRVVLRGLADRNEAERLGENIRSQLGITYLIRQK